MTARILLVLGAAALICGCSSLSSSGPTRSPAAARPAIGSVTIVLNADQVAMIRAYYGAGARDPGRGQGRGRGRDGLPPGIAMNLARGKPLPPGIAKQALPRDLLVRLPSLPSGYEYAVAAGKLLLIAVATQAVHDILVEALFG